MHLTASIWILFTSVFVMYMLKRLTPEPIKNEAETTEMQSHAHAHAHAQAHTSFCFLLSHAEFISMCKSVPLSVPLHRTSHAEEQVCLYAFLPVEPLQTPGQRSRRARVPAW